MIFLRCISLVGWTLSATHSASGIPRLAGSGVRLGLALNSRQAGLPNAPQCDSTCDPIGTILGGGSCPPTECCMPVFQSGYFNCVKCVGLATNATTADWAVAQNDVDGLTIACSKEGFALPELTLPTQNPNRTLATVSGSQTSAHSFAQITISALPSSGNSLAPSTTNSQKTVTVIPTESSAPSSTGPPSPTNSPSGAMVHTGGFGVAVALLGAIVSFGL